MEQRPIAAAVTSQGGSSSVFEARQMQPPRRVAIMVLRDVRSAEAIRWSEQPDPILIWPRVERLLDRFPSGKIIPRKYQKSLTVVRRTR